MDVKGSEVEPTSFGGSQYMWGNMPALDVLKLDQNEGYEVSRDYALLFAGKTATLNIVVGAESSQPPVIFETW